MDKRKILFDCDTGTDDAIAIVAALYADNLEVVGFTTVTGNVSVKYTSENTLNLVRYLGFDQPVAVGAWRPLKLHTDKCYAEETHGKAGLGDVSLPQSGEEFYRSSAVEMIYEKASEYGGELEIVATGPLTNLAVALIMYPEIRKMVKKLWVMGGAIYGGNVTTTAEFNIWCDPEAARMVFQSGIPCTLVGLDVTQKAVLTKEDIAFMRGLGTKAGDFVADMLGFMERRRERGGEDLLMHDALALAAAACPECLEYKDYYVDVDCEGSYTFGHTEMDVWGYTGKEPNVTVAEDIHFAVFRDWLWRTLKNSQKQYFVHDF